MMTPYAPVAEEAERLAHDLRPAILEGKYSPSGVFPSLRELARTHGKRLRVVMAATDILVREGLLCRRGRGGTFVRSVAGGGAADEPARLRCVTILERPVGTTPPFVRMQYLQGHTEALDPRHLRMRVMPLPASPAALPRALSDGDPFREQGCILINIYDPAVYNWLREHGVPFVVQNYRQYSREALPPHHSVVVNKVGGAFMATRKLIDLGHRRIGFAGNRPDDDRTTHEVYEGYAAALHCAALTVRKEDILDIETEDFSAAHLLASPLLRGRDLPTAIMAQNDSAAIGILRAARKLGIRVPEDLSVVGFNDQAEAALSEPPLTTMAVPRVQLGREAVETLLRAAADPEMEPVSKVLECHLVERMSAGQPPKAEGVTAVFRLTEDGRGGGDRIPA